MNNDAANEQLNYFAAIAERIFAGASATLRDYYLDPAPLARDLDLARFTGRGALIDQIDAFIRARPRGYVLIVAGPGAGKSALAAHLAGTQGAGTHRTGAQPWAQHFTRLPGGRSPEAARKNLAAQLIARWGLDAWAPGGALPPAAAQPGWFAELLAAAASRCRAEADGSRIVLVVDDLDEFEGATESADPPLGLPASLPDGVFVVATSRRGLDPVGDPADWLATELDGAGNREDQRRFIGEVTAADGGDRRLIEAIGAVGMDPARFRREAARTAAGVWIYLRYVLDEIAGGVRDPRGVGDLPGDLAGFYAELVRRWRGDPGDAAARQCWEQVRLPLLGVLAVARAPLTVPELVSFAGVPAAETARAFIEQTMRAFLSDGGDAPPSAPRYALRHQSLRDLLAGTAGDGPPELASLAPVFAEQAWLANQRITAALIPAGSPAERDWASAGPYARRHLAAHAAAADSLDSLAGDPGFLLATDPVSFLAQRARLRTQEGRRALTAFELSLGSEPGPANRENSGADDPERMGRLAAGATRVRATALATACAQRCADEWPVGWAAWAGEGYRGLTGYDGWVLAVAIGRAGDGDVLVSGAVDGTVRMWDAASGEPASGPLAGHDRAVYAVAIGRTGNRDIVLAGYRDGTVRTWDAATGWPAGPALTGNHGAVTAVGLGRAGDQDVIITGARDGAVRTWDLSTGEPTGPRLTGHDGAVTVVAAGWAGNRDIIISGSRDGTVRAWDAAAGGPPVSAHSAHHRPVTSVASGQTGLSDVIISADSGGTVLVHAYRS